MVDPILLEKTRAVLGSQPRKILITGGTGFVGSHLARCLAEAGHQVTVTGRSRYRTRRIAHPNICFVKSDVRDAQHIDRLCRDQETVFHAAALTAPWGERNVMNAINVEGTQNVVNACRLAGVKRLVHVSSTSVFFNYLDLLDHSDLADYPTAAACPYSASKRAAEEVVRSAAEQGQDVFTVRARAVFGPGDTVLLPRLVQAARDGRLKQIGNGENLIDLTYIDKLVYALVLSMERGKPGGICTVTNNEPVKVWNLLPEIFGELGIKYTGAQVPYPVAYAAAWLGEWWHYLLRRSGEPKLTRYAVGLLAKHQVFSQESAKQELGYEPFVPMRDAIQRTIASWNQTVGPTGDGVARLQLFTTGYSENDRKFVEYNAVSEKIKFHALVGLISHPVHGHTLFDTGYAPRLPAMSGIWAGLYNRMVTARTCDELGIANQLQQAGVDPNKVKRVVISHFHPDHIAGLKDFPEAEFIASFGDQTVRLFELPGHAVGQMGALVQTDSGAQEFLVADSAWTSNAITNKIMPHWITRIFLGSFADTRRTLKKLNWFGQQFPDVRLIPTHCP